jgi:hypothetical protein
VAWQVRPPPEKILQAQALQAEKKSNEVSIMKVVQRNQGTENAKWNHLPIGMPYWNGGPWKGQPALFKPKQPAFARRNEPPPELAEASKRKYEPAHWRVMF